jgi:formylmethanofuran dehydrogenase subunit E
MSHQIYKKEDFTKEEIERDNIIARMVINHGQLICKKCGEIIKDVNKRCKNDSKYNRLATAHSVRVDHE